MQQTLVTRRIYGLHISTGTDAVGGGGQRKRAVRHPVECNRLTGRGSDGREVALKAGYAGLRAVASCEIRSVNTMRGNRPLSRLMGLACGISHGAVPVSSGHQDKGDR